MPEEATGAPPAGYESDSIACRLIVAAYTDAADTIKALATEAARRIMMSPDLSDMMEVGFADIGARPPVGTADGLAAEPITHGFTTPGNDAGRHFFALMIVDASAAAVETAFAGLRSSPLIAALSPRLRGLAARDDREPGAEAGRRSPATEIRISSPGAWTMSDLVDQVRIFAEDLFRGIASTGEPGLGPEELASIRSRLDAVPIAPPAQPGDDPEPPGERARRGSAPVPPRGPAPDETRPVGRLLRRWRHRADNPAASPAPAPSPAPAASPAPAPSPTPAASPAPASSRAPAPGPALGPAPAAGPARAPGAAPGGSATPVRDAERAPATGGSRLAYLMLVGDESGEDRAAWRRGRALLLEVDRKLAKAALPVNYQVRAWQDSENPVRSALRGAGQLTRGDLRRTPSSLDFPRSLRAVCAALTRDSLRITGAGTPAPKPVIVLFAGGIPLADPVTTELYNELADDASLVWVVPEKLDSLMSPVFKAGASRILTDHQEVADEVVGVLTGSAERPRPPAAPQ